VARPRKGEEGHIDSKVVKLGAEKEKLIKISLIPVTKVGGDYKTVRK
jgi:hypothetical protein